MNRFAVVIALVAAVVVGAAVAAQADTPKPQRLATIDPGAGSNLAADRRYCDIYTNPYPQYSASDRTLRFGGKIVCNYTDALWVDATLFPVVGTGENQHNVWADQLSDGEAGTQHGNTTYDACVATTSTRYILKVAGTAATLGSNCGWSPVFTYPCGDVV